MLLPGIVSVTFRRLAPQEVVAVAVEASLAGIEWGGDIHVPAGDLRLAAEVARMSADAGLEVSAYGSYYRAGASGTGGGGSDGGFGSVLETAVALGAPTVRVWAGKHGSSAVTQSERESIVSDLKRICDLSEAAGISVSTEFHAGTLTDTASSAVRLLEEGSRPNLFTFWQPPNGAPADDCLAGLRTVLPFLSNLHVFHWWPDTDDRRPLAEGSDRWREYLRLAATAPGHHFASLEFVERDDIECFLRDARTLLRWLDAR